MVSLSYKAIGGAVATYLLVQPCPAPPLAIPLITDAALQVTAAVGSAGASFAGAIVGANVGGKRYVVDGRAEKITAPAGVPQQEFDRCANDMGQGNVKVTVKGPVQNNGKS